MKNVFARKTLILCLALFFLSCEESELGSDSVKEGVLKLSSITEISNDTVIWQVDESIEIEFDSNCESNDCLSYLFHGNTERNSFDGSIEMINNRLHIEYLSTDQLETRIGHLFLENFGKSIKLEVIGNELNFFTHTNEANDYIFTFHRK